MSDDVEKRQDGERRDDDRRVRKNADYTGPERRKGDRRKHRRRTV